MVPPVELGLEHGWIIRGVNHGEQLRRVKVSQHETDYSVGKHGAEWFFITAYLAQLNDGLAR